MQLTAVHVIRAKQKAQKCLSSHFQHSSTPKEERNRKIYNYLFPIGSESLRVSAIPPTSLGRLRVLQHRKHKVHISASDLRGVIESPHLSAITATQTSGPQHFDSALTASCGSPDTTPHNRPFTVTPITTLHL